MSSPVLYLMLGYPGAGKTTVATIISELTGASRLSSDDVRFEMFPHPSFSEAEHTKLYKELNKRSLDLLKAGKSVVYDANLNRYQHRQEKYDLCNQTGATVQLIWVKTDRDLAKERATHESRAPYIPSHETAHDMFDRIADVIEPPHADEKAIIIDGTNVSSADVKARLGI